MNQFDYSITKKVKTMEALKNRIFYGKMDYLPLWPNYISEKGRTLGKTYGINAKCYWEPNGNPLELEGYMLGTNENWKYSSPPSPLCPKLKKIKIKAF
jgi:hypothetical protein